VHSGSHRSISEGKELKVGLPIGGNLARLTQENTVERLHEGNDPPERGGGKELKKELFAFLHTWEIHLRGQRAIKREITSSLEDPFGSGGGEGIKPVGGGGRHPLSQGETQRSTHSFKKKGK